MKRLLTSLALVFATVAAFAQTIPANMRFEFAQLTENDKKVDLFALKDTDGAFGYFLGLGTPDAIPGTVLVFDDISETCIFLGETLSEAKASLEGILALFSEPSGTTKDYASRMAVGSMILEKGVATAVVKSRFLAGKRLSFFYTNSRYTTETYLRKSVAKSLVELINEYMAIHPEVK